MENVCSRFCQRCGTKLYIIEWTVSYGMKIILAFFVDILENFLTSSKDDFAISGMIFQKLIVDPLNSFNDKKYPSSREIKTSVKHFNNPPVK